MLATAKIHILKQFTTHHTCVTWKVGLCLLLQRYTFWSNSQHGCLCNGGKSHCACYCKDTHFEAIHNSRCLSMTLTVIVLATAKIHILKQFTTVYGSSVKRRVLCLLLQRYTFWSNSQRYLPLYINWYIVLATAKIHILKQFTTTPKQEIVSKLLCLLLQRYTFWSNSQLSHNQIVFNTYCACYCKDTHFEAIHNTHANKAQKQINCACYCKDTHFEAIHN